MWSNQITTNRKVCLEIRKCSCQILLFLRFVVCASLWLFSKYPFQCLNSSNPFLGGGASPCSSIQALLPPPPPPPGSGNSLFSANPKGNKSTREGTMTVIQRNNTATDVSVCIVALCWDRACRGIDRCYTNWITNYSLAYIFFSKLFQFKFQVIEAPNEILRRVFCSERQKQP